MTIELEDVKYDPKDNIIVVNGRPSPTSANIVQAIQQALDLSKTTDCKSILVNGMEVNTLPPPLEIWKISVELVKQINNILKMRVAYAISDSIISNFGFFEDYLTNRGVPIQKFNNLDDAKRWLLDDD